MPDTIDLNKLKNSGTSEEVLDVYGRVKRDLVECTDRQTWEKNRERCWNAAYPLDPEKDDTIWTAVERESMIKKGQIPISINDLAKGIQVAAAVVTSKKPGIIVKPIGSSDLYISELFQRGIDYVWGQNDGSIEVFDFVKEAKVGGLGFLEVKHDESKGIFGKIIFGCTDPTAFYYDKKSKKRDLSDVSFGKAHLITKKHALETYEGLKEEDLIFTELQKEENKGVPDGKTGQDNYVSSPGDPSPKGPTDKEEEENVWEIEDWELSKEKELWLMVPKPEGGYDRQTFKKYSEIEDAGWLVSPDKKTAQKVEQTMMGVYPNEVAPQEAVIWPRKVEKRIQRIIVGKKLISSEANPLGIDSDGDPVTPDITLMHDRTLAGFPTSPTMRALEVTRNANKGRMQLRYMLSKNVDATMIMPEGCKWEKDEVHGDYIRESKDAMGQVRNLPPATSTMEVVNGIQLDEAKLNDEYDMNDVIRGKIPAGQSNIAGRTVLALQDMVGVTASPFITAFESALAKLGKCLCVFMLKTWPRSMWERLIEEDEWGSWQPEEQQQMDAQGQPMQVDPNSIKAKWDQALEKIRPADDGQEPGISLIDLDIRIIAGSTQPTNRMAKQEVAQGMVEKGIYDVEAALKYVDDPLKDEILERKKMAAQNAAPEKISVTVPIKDVPGEAQAQILQKIGVQMNPQDAVIQE